MGNADPQQNRSTSLMTRGLWGSTWLKTVQPSGTDPVGYRPGRPRRPPLSIFFLTLAPAASTSTRLQRHPRHRPQPSPSLDSPASSSSRTTSATPPPPLPPPSIAAAANSSSTLPPSLLHFGGWKLLHPQANLNPELDSLAIVELESEEGGGGGG